MIPEPTRALLLNVAIPATSRIPVLTFAVLIPTPFISLNDVAVITPTTLIPDSLDVTADPTVVCSNVALVAPRSPVFELNVKLVPVFAGRLPL